MANMVGKINQKINTTNLIITEEFTTVILDKEQSEALFKKTPIAELKIELITANEDAEMSFQIGEDDFKKGGKIEYSLRTDAAGLFVSIDGEFSIKLRKGADVLLKKLGNDLDVRIRAVTWKGGYYQGFSAPVEGGDFAAEKDSWEKTFPRVMTITIK